MEYPWLSLPTIAATQELGASIARVCQQSMVCYLLGDLGVGKTTWCQGFLTALGYIGVVKSPTYTLVEPYQLSHWQVYHWDLYRLHCPEELETIGIRDYQPYLYEKRIQLIEWPEKGLGRMPAADLKVNLIYHDTTGRQGYLQSCSMVGYQLLQRLQDA